MDLYLPKRRQPEPQFSCITKQLCGANGIPIWNSGDNPILDMRMYKVEYADGEKFAFSANMTAENMVMQIDEEGNRHVLMDEIT